MDIRSLSASFLILGSLCLGAGAGVQVDADHPLIRYMGRFDFSDPKNPRCDWPGASIQAKFTGPSVTVRISGGTNDFNVFIDGVFRSHLVLEAGKTAYVAATGLSDAPHTLLLTKRTEGFNGIATFSGLTLADGKGLVALPPRTAAKLQFIGDSFTVGYGDEADVLVCPDRRPFDNNYMAYGPLTARALDAEYSVQAVSGAGMVHNYGDTSPISAAPMPTYFDRTLFGSATPKWNFSAWVPDLVVIALGTNDFSTAVKPSREQYTSAYKAFITKVRGHFPAIRILCMTYAVDQYQGVYVEAMVKDLAALGDTHIHFVAMPSLTTSDLGCDYHPNLSGQKKYSEALIPVVRKYLGSTTGLLPRGGALDSQGLHYPAQRLARFFKVPGTGEFSDVSGRILGP